MPYSVPLPAPVLRQLKSAGRGLTGRLAGIKIMEAVLAHFRQVEITVLNGHGDGELFRIGTGNPRHGIHGVHIHPVMVHSQTFQLEAAKHAVLAIKDEDFNMYLGLLLQALELGRYRVGFKKM